MATTFGKNETYNALLYLLGHFKDNTCCIYKLCKLLYFADQLSLSRYGHSITGDDYIAMRHGPVPYNVSNMFRALNGASFFFSKELLAEARNLFLCINRDLIKGKKPCDRGWLSIRGKECLDASLTENSLLSLPQLESKSLDTAWEHADVNDGVIDPVLIAKAGNADEATLEYIAEQCIIDQILS